jgi:O-antigen/teichoic acid export membrane protein
MSVEAVLQSVIQPRTNRDGATHKFIRDIFFSNLPVPFQKFCSYLLLVVFARKLGARDYGAWSLFIVSLTIAMATATLNAGSSMMRFLNGDRTAQDIDQSISTVFTMVGATAVAVATVIAGLSKWGAANIFHDSRDRVLLLLLAATLPFSCLFEEVRGFLRARRLNRNWAFLTLSRLIPETLALVLIAGSLLGVTAIAWAYLVCEVLAAVCAVFYLCRYRRIRFVGPSRAVMTRYLSFGVPLLPGALAYFLQISADRYLVGYYLDLKQVGIYSICFSISALAFFLLGPINDVLVPELSTLYDAGDSQAFLQRFSGIQKFVFGSSLGAAALLTAFPADVLMIFSSRDFISGDTTLVILGIQGIFMALVLLYAVLLSVRLKVWSYSWFWVGSGVVIVVLDMLLVPRIGIAGAAVSQLVATAGGAIVLVGLNWQIFRQSFRPAWLLQNGVAFAAVFAVATIWKHSLSSGVLESCVHLVAGSAAFVVGLAVTGYLRSSDFELFRAALLNRAA